MVNNILVVDDEKEVRDFLSKALSRLGGYQVEMAANGNEALKKLDAGKFDLVITDLKMPGMDGLQLVTEISGSRPETLTVLMTGHGTIDSALEAMKRGASDYLTKPLHLDETLLRLKKVLEGKQRFVRLKDYADQLERANQELRRIDIIKSEFVSIASHELRTPLASIKNAIQLIASGKAGQVNETQGKFLSMAERNIVRLTNILNNLLNLSKIESGKITMNFEELSPKALIEFILSSLKPQSDEKSIQLKLDLPEEPPTVYGDRDKVEQILTNLVGNAVKFTPEGGEITVSAKRYGTDGKMVAFSVTDSGIGIPEDQLEKIFEKFHQVEDSLHRSTGGTGLGLAITRGLAAAHQGKIWVESRPGRGSCFTFTIPVFEAERRDANLRLILDREFRRAQENQAPLTLFLIKLEDQIEGEGDGCLKELESRITQYLCRKSDILLRKRGEKVLVALCEADLKGAQAIRLRLEEGFKNNPVKEQGKPLAIKIGNSTYPEVALSKRELFGKAKEELRKIL